MATPRSDSVDTSRTRFYLCTTRCVQGEYLLGRVKETGQDFSHRKAWILSRLAQLVDAFAIDLVAYTIMSNHYHLVIRIDIDRVATWSDDEVIERWLRVHKGPNVIHDFLAGKALTDAQLAKVNELVARWRERLQDISTFMSRLNHRIACLANKESGEKGHFWQERFHSRALEDEAALLSSMAYVDLNPIRADISKGLKSSDFTSIQARLKALASEANGVGIGTRGGHRIKGKNSRGLTILPKLMKFSDESGATAGSATLNFSLADYIRMVEWTGRVAKHGKRGRIPPGVPSVLDELGMNARQWTALALEVPKKQIVWLNGQQRVASLANEAWRH